MNKLNMINKYNKLITILVITFSMIMGVSGVRGEEKLNEIKFIGSNGAPADNKSCTTDSAFCATDIEGSGFKISLVKKDGTVDSFKYFINITNLYDSIESTYGGQDGLCSQNGVLKDWVKSNEKQIPYVNGDKEIFNTIFGENKVVDLSEADYIGLQDSKLSSFTYEYIEGGKTYTGAKGSGNTINSNSASVAYDIYFNKVLMGNMGSKYVEEILKKIKGDFVNILDYVDYYLKFEPLYSIREFVNATNGSYLNGTWGSYYCHHYIGTTRDILESFGQKSHDSRKFSMGYYFVGGGRVLSSMFGGNWNATRNYIVSLYTPCLGNGGIFNESNDKCYPNDDLNTKYADYNLGKNNIDLNSMYKTKDKGLGVGYVLIGKIIKTHKVRIIKYNTSGNEISLNGSIFGFYKEDCNTPLDSTKPVVGLNGYYSTYYDFQYEPKENEKICIKEIKAPKGYDLPPTNSSGYTGFDSDGHPYIIKKYSSKDSNFVFEFKDPVAPKSVTVKKHIDSISGKLLKTKSVKFLICQGADCSPHETNNGEFSYNETRLGNFKLYEQVPDGYSNEKGDIGTSANLKNISKTAYKFSEEMYDIAFDFEIKDTDTDIVLEVSNKEIKCADEFERLGAVNSLEIRYKLYKKYEDEDGNHFNNLLNMSIPNGETACTYTACKIVSDDRCLVTNFHSEYDYHATNSTSLALDPKDTGYACYTDVINDGSQDIGICNTDFKFRNRFGAGGANFVFEAERGLAFTNTTEAGTGTLTKTCESIIGGRNLTTPSIEKANDNNIKVELNYNNVNVVKKGEASIKNEQGNNTPNISYEIETEFSFLNSYITRGPTGELKLKKFKNAYISGYFMSSIDDPIPNNTIGEIEFGYSLEYTSDNRAYSTSGGKLGNSSKVCKYKLTDGLIPGGDPGKRSLNIEFRTIDINDPFPGKDGKGRTVGVNWLGKCLPMIVDDGSGSAVELNPLDPSVCDTKSNSNLMNYLVSYAKSHGINRKDIDGSLTGIDLPEFANFFNKKNIILANYINKINVGNYDYSSKRSIVDKYITYATNSYGQQKDSTGKIEYKKPIYTMVLTPSDIKQIREYNKETSYDDYVSVSGKICDRDAGDTDECFLDKENYEMKFIEGIKNTNTPTITTLKNKTLLKLKNSLKTA